MQRSEATVWMSDVRKRFGSTTALDGLTLAVPAGRITGILGPNGAGKTTALEICAGLCRPDTGRVTVLGRDPWRSSRNERARVGVMLQRGGVWSGATPRQAIEHVARFFERPADPALLMERLSLAPVARTPFRRLSGGEQQRVKLACAIVGRPELVILDEPSSGLDPGTRRDVWQLIRQLRTSGVTVVLSTHSLEEAEQLSDSITIVDRGRVAAHGTPQDLKADPNGQTLRFSAVPSLDRTGLLRALPVGFELVEDSPGRYRLSGSDISPQVVAAVTAWCAEHGVLASELNVQQRNLEQVFLDVTAQQVNS